MMPAAKNTTPTPEFNQSLAELKQAVRLIENATFDLADKAPSAIIVELIQAAADVERLIKLIAPHSDRSH